MHNHSTPLGDKARAIYYPPTGTGRDTYIMTDNGGTNITYRPQGVPHTGNYMKFGAVNKSYKPCSYTRFQKYVSDGTGRDQYVVYILINIDPTTEGSTMRKTKTTCSWENSETQWETGDGRTKLPQMVGTSRRNKADRELSRNISAVTVLNYPHPRDFQGNTRKSWTNAERLSMDDCPLMWLWKLINIIASLTAPPHILLSCTTTICSSQLGFDGFFILLHFFQLENLCFQECVQKVMIFCRN